MDNRPTDDVPAVNPALARYEAPVLNRLGDVREVTLGSSTGVGDSPTQFNQPG